MAALTTASPRRPAIADGGGPDPGVATRAVLAEMRALTSDAQTVSDPLRGLLERALAVAERQAGGTVLPCIELPLVIYACLGGDWPDAVPLAAAATWIYLGADVLDNIADGEVPSEWDGASEDELVLAGATMASALPVLALGRLRLRGRPVRHLPRLALRQARTIAVMAGGQLGDLAGADEPAAALETVVAKSGAQAEGAAALAAMLACPRGRCVHAAEMFGRAAGIAVQLGSDCHDIWLRRPSHDLASGRRTLPVAFGLSSVGPVERARLLALLDAARSDAAVHDEVAGLLARLGALEYLALRVQVSVQHGRTELAELAAHGHEIAPLRQRIDSLSLLS